MTGGARTPGGLDRLVRLDPGSGGVAIRNVPGTLSIFDSHFPRFPVLPGVLLLETMAQLAGLALGDGSGGWQLCQAEVVRFRHFVRPGDQAEITVRVLDSTVDAGSCAATVTVDGRTVATARRLRLVRAPAGAAAAAAAPRAAGRFATGALAVGAPA
jgi:3-hydroxyacyl-[acyl-carrier-protein] dehydratase